MSTVQPEGINLHGASSGVLEGERKLERERWPYGLEPWSPEYQRLVSMEVVSSGSMIEATGGFAAIVMCILGLFNVAPMYLIPISTLVIGVALMFEGGAVALRFWKLPAEITTGQWAAMQLAEGMIAEFFAGITGVVLGILAILGFAPLILSAVATLVFGGALVLGSGLTSRLNSLEYGHEDVLSKREFYRQYWFLSQTAALVQLACGGVAILLGILALMGIASFAFTTVALLILGCSALISGSAISGRIMHLLHRC